MSCPFTDITRKSHYIIIYNWAQNVLKKPQKNAHFIAKNNTLKKYPMPKASVTVETPEKS